MTVARLCLVSCSVCATCSLCHRLCVSNIQLQLSWYPAVHVLTLLLLDLSPSSVFFCELQASCADYYQFILCTFEIVMLSMRLINSVGLRCCTSCVTVITDQ